MAAPDIGLDTSADPLLIVAPNARDLASQANLCPSTMEAFYLWRNVSRSDVLAEKRRVFRHPRTHTLPCNIAVAAQSLTPARE
jgi:hypothetical protein